MGVCGLAVFWDVAAFHYMLCTVSKRDVSRVREGDAGYDARLRHCSTFSSFTNEAKHTSTIRR